MAKSVLILLVLVGLAHSKTIPGFRKYLSKSRADNSDSHNLLTNAQKVFDASEWEEQPVSGSVEEILVLRAHPNDVYHEDTMEDTVPNHVRQTLASLRYIQSQLASDPSSKHILHTYAEEIREAKQLIDHLHSELQHTGM